MAASFRITNDPGEAGVFDLRAEDDLKDPVDVDWLGWNKDPSAVEGEAGV